MVTKRLSAFVIALALLTGVPANAWAHRLDEYLQQTLFEFQQDKVVVHVTLTPGVSIAADILAAIDTDHDGFLSNPEQFLYAQAVQSDLSLALDGHELPLQLIDRSYPPVEALSGGTGSVELTLAAAIPAGIHTGTIQYANHHRGEISVYLVNALLPHLSTIHVGAQTRNPNQSTYQVPVTVDGAPTDKPLGAWISIGLMGVVGAFAFWAIGKRKAPRAGGEEEKNGDRRTAWEQNR